MDPLLNDEFKLINVDTISYTVPISLKAPLIFGVVVTVKPFEGAVKVGYKVGYNIKFIICSNVFALNVVPDGIVSNGELPGKFKGVGVAFVKSGSVAVASMVISSADVCVIVIPAPSVRLTVESAPAAASKFKGTLVPDLGPASNV